MTQNAKNLIWIDLEMTGLDTTQDQIIEIATIVTNSNLETLAEGPVIAIHQQDAALEVMDDWNKKHHKQSGLLDRVKQSDVSEATAEKQTIDFLQQWVPLGKSPMCGNSICQDRRFLARCMPDLEAYFLYRNLDVSTLKELAKRWAPDLYNNFKKNNTHLALDDIRESINELRYYRENFIKIG